MYSTLLSEYSTVGFEHGVERTGVAKYATHEFAKSSKSFLDGDESSSKVREGHGRSSNAPSVRGARVREG